MTARGLHSLTKGVPNVTLQMCSLCAIANALIASLHPAAPSDLLPALPPFLLDLLNPASARTAAENMLLSNKSSVQDAFTQLMDLPAMAALANRCKFLLIPFSALDTAVVPRVMAMAVYGQHPCSASRAQDPAVLFSSLARTHLSLPEGDSVYTVQPLGDVLVVSVEVCAPRNRASPFSFSITRRGRSAFLLDNDLPPQRLSRARVGDCSELQFFLTFPVMFVAHIVPGPTPGPPIDSIPARFSHLPQPTSHRPSSPLFSASDAPRDSKPSQTAGDPTRPSFRPSRPASTPARSADPPNLPRRSFR
jgi:hypothetical protein